MEPPVHNQPAKRIQRGEKKKRPLDYPIPTDKSERMTQKKKRTH